MDPERLSRLAAAVSLLLGLQLVAACGGDPDEPGSEGTGTDRLDGAEVFAAGGDTPLGELTPGDATLDQAPVDRATLVSAGADDYFYVLFRELDYLVDAASDGRIEQLGYASTGSAVQGQTVVGISPAGGMAVAQDAPDEASDAWRLLIRDYNETFDLQVEVPFAVGAVAIAEDRSMVVGSRDEARIDAVDPAGNIVGLLGPEGSGARVVPDEPLGPVVALLRLPDDRVVFVADTSDGYQLHLLDDTEVQPVGDPSPRVDPLAATPLAPAPGGRVLTVGLGSDDDPMIAVVNVDAGMVEVLAVLEGVEPSVERPVSAVAVGDEVVFLADDRLWRLDEVL